MRTTIDKAGRVVIPKAFREQVGLSAGEVELTIDGAGLRLEAVAGEELEMVGGRLVIPASGAMLTDLDVQTLIDADRR